MNISFKIFFYKIILLSIIYPLNTFCQEKKLIEILEAGKLSRDEEKFPKANILSKGKNLRVKLYHEGATIISDKTLFYSTENRFFAKGNVMLEQGDSLELKSEYLNYDGNKRMAKA